jgi:hypothetical protein
MVNQTPSLDTVKVEIISFEKSSKDSIKEEEV